MHILFTYFGAYPTLAISMLNYILGFCGFTEPMSAVAERVLQSAINKVLGTTARIFSVSVLTGGKPRSLSGQMILFFVRSS